MLAGLDAAVRQGSTESAEKVFFDWTERETARLKKCVEQLADPPAVNGIGHDQDSEDEATLAPPQSTDTARNPQLVCPDRFPNHNC